LQPFTYGFNLRHTLTFEPKSVILARLFLYRKRTDIIGADHESI